MATVSAPPPLQEPQLNGAETRVTTPELDARANARDYLGLG